MKPILSILLFLTLLASPALADDGELRLRIMSYNIHIGVGMDGGGPKLERIAKIVTDAGCDLAGLQEIDQNTQRTGGVDQLTELAKLAEMHGEFAKAIPHQGGAYGVGMLSRAKPLRAYSMPLPGKEEARVLQIVEFERFVLFNTHFSLREESRQQSVEIIEKERAKFPAKPVFLTGDFNDTPDSDTVAALLKTWTRLSGPEPTYSTQKPQTTIDYIFAALPPGFTATVEKHRRVEQRVASDHFPIWVDVTVLKNE